MHLHLQLAPLSIFRDTTNYQLSPGVQNTIVHGNSEFHDGECVASGGLDRKINIWDIASGDIVATLEEQATPVDSVCFSPCGTLLVSGSSDVIVWDCETWTRRQIFTEADTEFNSVKFNRTSDKIVSTSDDNAVRVWSLETNMAQLKIEVGCDCLYSASFNNVGDLIAVIVDNEVRLYDAATGELKQRLTGHSEDVSFIEFSQDSSMLVSGEGKSVILWDVISGSVLRELRGHTKGLIQVHFNGDASRILSGSSDTTARIWDVSSGECLLVLHVHKRRVFSCCFSEDGSKVITGCEYGTISVWDSFSGEELRTLGSPTDKSVYSLSYRPNVVGSYI